MDSLGSRRVGFYREQPGSDILKQGCLKKMKSHTLQTIKKKYFVLRSTSSSGPARLDYFDSEKKFKANHPPKKTINLHVCFNINKKADSKHKFGIAMFHGSECFSVIAESEIDQEDWLGKLLEYQNEYLPEGEPPKTHYEFVWQGIIKKKSKTSCPRIEGPYRLCLSSKEVSLVEFEKYHPTYTFQFASIRRCGHSDNFFFMEVGRSAITGSGELWMQVDETHTAQTMHDAVLDAMAASRASLPEFRKRSNTGSSGISQANEILNIRKRATSESHHQHPGSPRRHRSMVGRPQSTVVYPPRATSNQILMEQTLSQGSSPSTFDHSLLESRVRTDSMGSRTSRTSRHSDMTDSMYENTSPGTPITNDGSFISSRSQTPDANMCMSDDHNDSMMSNSHYLPMTPGQRSMTPSPTRGQAAMERSGYSSDYLPMTPGQRSGTPSPTRHLSDRPASAGSDGHESVGRSEGYMVMRPGSIVSSPANNQDGYMDMTPRTKAPTNDGYMSMTPPMTPPMSMTPPKGASTNDGYMSMTPAVNNTVGYVDMTPGQRMPADPGPGYMMMDGGRTRMTAPIPIRPNKEPGYMDMGPGSQPLPTVKESGSGEAYLPMSPSDQSPMSSEGLKPAKVISYLSDDSMSGEFPKRAYSVGSRPAPKSSYRYHQQPELLRRQPLDSSKSSSAPHLIVQKSRSPYIDAMHRNAHLDSYTTSPLSSSIKSDDSDSFMEMEFYRPRTASDSYGCRPRSSSFGKQIIQGHRPRSSSYGQGSKGNISKLAAGLRTDSMDSMRSQDIHKRRSQESLGKMSNSSRNSSSESLKKLSDDLHNKKILLTSDYMDMGFDKRKTPSPNVHGTMSPQTDTSGYVDMTLGSSAPKSSSSMGVSPSSSTHSLGSSPASTGHVHHDKSSHGYHDKSAHGSAAKVIKASGKQVQKPVYKSTNSPVSGPSDNQLKVAQHLSAKLKMADKRSPSSSGKESEDESYVPFHPGYSSPSTTHAHGTSSATHGAQDDVAHKSLTTSQPSQDYGSKARHAMKVQHGYSKSYDSAMRNTEKLVVVFEPITLASKHKKEKEHKTKSDDEGKVEKTAFKSRTKSEKDRKRHEKETRRKAESAQSKVAEVKNKSPSQSSSNLQEKALKGSSPTPDKKVGCIPDDDLFSNKQYQTTSPGQSKSPEKVQGSPGQQTSTQGHQGSRGSVPSGEESSYLEYDPSLHSKTNSSKESSYLEYDPSLNSKTNSSNESSYLEYDPSLNSKTKSGAKSESVTETRERNVSKSPNRSSVTVKDLKRKSLVDREYCEIDLKLPESDYVEADPAIVIKTVIDFSSKSSSKSLGQDDFSYMDFDPSFDKKPDEHVPARKNENVKAPQRVRSFISIEAEQMEDECFDEKKVGGGKESETKTTSSHEGVNKGASSSGSGSTAIKSNQNTERDGNRGTGESMKSGGRRKSSSGEGNKRKVSSTGDSGNRLTSSSEISKKKTSSGDSNSDSQAKLGQGKVEVKGAHGGTSRSLSQGHESDMKVKGEVEVKTGGVLERKVSQEDSEKGIGSRENIASVKVCSIDNSSGKLVVKSTMPLRPDGQPVEDEGYCDILDFDKENKDVVLPVKSAKCHHRSESTSSSNSERSRKFMDSVTSEDDIVCPETPKSFISEDGDTSIPIPETPISYISDESLNGASSCGRDVGSPLKQPLGCRRSSPSLGKEPGPTLQGFGLTSGDLRKSLPSNKTGQGGVMCRQTSVPVGPCKSPRSSGENQTRIRNPSGPAAMPSGMNMKTGNGNGATSKFSAQASLEPLISGQELHKQQSMPCMVLPMAIEKVQKSSDSPQDIGQSRHSFTDLSQYQLMTFSANNLESTQQKSNSQQQLSDTSSELHYVDLDLKNSTENVDEKSSTRVKSRHPSSLDDLTQGSVPYAQIDYLKTADKDVKFTIQ